MLSGVYAQARHRLGLLEKRLRLRARLPRKAVTVIPQDQWSGLAQEGEFQFHKHDTWRQTADFMAQTDLLFRHFGFSPDGWEGKTILDLGSGSKLRTRWFKGAYLVAIEPLADRFRAEIAWSDVDSANEVFSVPAEQRIEGLVGKADLVVSINVLDHCFNFASIMGNVRDYLAPNGLAFISYDMHQQADDLHPLELTIPSSKRIFAEQGLTVERVTTGLGAEVSDGEQTYGHGDYCLNFWLRAA